MCRKGAGDELTVAVTFMKSIQSRMHGLKKERKNDMMKPDGETCPDFFRVTGRRFGYEGDKNKSVCKEQTAIT